MNPLPSRLIHLCRHGALSVALLALLLGGLVGSGLVLCIGGGGHVAVEPAAAPFHAADSRLAAAAACIDLAVVAPAGPSTPRLAGPPPPLLVALLCLVWPLLSLRRPTGPPPCPRGGPDPRLIHHRTVLLLN